jgi:hypothetical protein
MAPDITTKNVGARLADVTNIAILVLIVFVGVRVARSYNSPRALTFEKGEKVNGVAAAAYSGAERTLIIQVRSTCQYCPAAMPFYRQLVDRIRKEQRGTRILAVSTEPPTISEAYLRANSIIVETMLQLDSKEPRLGITPGLLLLDKNGHVLGAWVGVLLPEQERDVVGTFGLQHQT